MGIGEGYGQGADEKAQAGDRQHRWGLQVLIIPLVPLFVLGFGVRVVVVYGRGAEVRVRAQGRNEPTGSSTPTQCRTSRAMHTPPYRLEGCGWPPFLKIIRYAPDESFASQGCDPGAGAAAVSGARTPRA